MRKYTAYLANSFFIIKDVWKKYPSYILVKILFAFLNVIPTVFGVYLLNQLVIYLERGNGNKIISYLVLYLFILSVINVLQSYVVNLWVPRKNEEISLYIQEKIYKVVIQYKTADLDDTNFVDKYYFVLQNSTTCILSLLDLISESLSVLIGVVSISMIIMTYDYVIIIILLFGVIVSTIIGINTKKVRKDCIIERTNSSRRTDYVRRTFYLKEFAEEIRIFNLYEFMMEYLRTSVKDRIEVIQKYGEKGFVLGAKQSIISTLYDWLVLTYLSIKTLNGKAPWGAFLITYNASKVFSGYLLQIIGNVSSFYDSNLYLETYMEFMNREHELTGKKLLNEEIQIIKFRSVTFGYSCKMILKNLNIIFRRGIITAIIGTNGAGKSTILKMIRGTLIPISGEVSVNQTNICNLDYLELSKHIGVVNQDFRFFAVSIASNILLKHNIEPEDREYINKLLKMVGLREKVNELPQGIDTVMTKEFTNAGAIFSGGEMQRLAIARACAQNTEVIILDEPFSSIDHESYGIISNILKVLAKDKMVIYVTHSVETLDIADEVLVINGNGRCHIRKKEETSYEKIKVLGIN